VNRIDPAQPRSTERRWAKPATGSREANVHLGEADRTEAEIRYGERTVDLARDFLQHCALADELVSRGKPAYDSDVLLQVAGAGIMTRLREVTNRLGARKTQPGGSTFMNDTPQVGWDRLRGLGSRTTHDYDDVDGELVWVALAEFVPKAEQAIRQAIGA
jgi:hypothetical protein